MSFENRTRNRCVLLSVLVLRAGAALAFTYSDFSSTAGLNLVGSAVQNGSVLRLTPSAGSMMGSAWYTQKQHVSTGFTTTFSFRFWNPGATPGADGISFNVQSVGTNAISDEQGTTGGLSISFNTFQYGDEPSSNFIGIYQNGYGSDAGRLYTFDLNATPIYMKDGNIHSATISYGGSGLSLSIDSLSIFNNLAVSLAPGLDPAGNAWVGFGSRTGLYYENHDLLNWSFAVPEPSSFALLVMGSGALALLRSRAQRKL